MHCGSPIESVTYWEKRAREFATRHRGLPAVCSYGMPSFYNEYIEAVQRAALLPLLPRVDDGTSTALDVGCGVGRWSLELAERGHDVTGIDLSPYMIERARGWSTSVCSFVVGDVVTLELGKKYDFIVCVTVIQHVLDPELARRAIARLAEHLAPNGTLVLLEAAPSRNTKRCDTSVFRARTLEWYLEALQLAGLKVIEQRGVDPTPFKTWLLPYYRRLPKALANVALLLTTIVSLPLDALLSRWLSRTSWHKVFVVRHEDSQA